MIPAFPPPPQEPKSYVEACRELREAWDCFKATLLNKLHKLFFEKKG